MCPLENYVVLIGYKLRQASDENKGKYCLGDYLLILY